MENDGILVEFSLGRENVFTVHLAVVLALPFHNHNFQTADQFLNLYIRIYLQFTILPFMFWSNEFDYLESSLKSVSRNVGYVQLV